LKKVEGLLNKTLVCPGERRGKLKQGVRKEKNKLIFVIILFPTLRLVANLAISYVSKMAT